jgi:Flp pilus assembly protein TadD
MVNVSVKKWKGGLNMIVLFGTPLGAVALVAVGTTVLLVATILLLLRANIQRRRPVVALTERWLTASTNTSGLVLALLSAIAVSCFANISAIDSAGPASTLAHSDLQHGGAVNADASTLQELDSLRAYANTIDEKAHSTTAKSAAAGAAELPDVVSMIDKLFARLEKQPDDVKGWKMLGWSYLNTNRPEEATRAYETALRLEPSDTEIVKGLEAAKSARTAATSSAPSDPAPSTTAETVKQ